jgi:hypothetical protein
VSLSTMLQVIKKSLSPVPSRRPPSALSPLLLNSVVATVITVT